MPLTLAPDESWQVGTAQVYDIVYMWVGGQWVLDSSREPLKVIPIDQMDYRPFDAREKSRGLPGYVPMYIARYYWAAAKRWVLFGSDQNF